MVVRRWWYRQYAADAPPPWTLSDPLRPPIIPLSHYQSPTDSPKIIALSANTCQYQHPVHHQLSTNLFTKLRLLPPFHTLHQKADYLNLQKRFIPYGYSHRHHNNIKFSVSQDKNIQKYYIVPYTTKSDLNYPTFPPPGSNIYLLLDPHRELRANQFASFLT